MADFPSFGEVWTNTFVGVDGIVSKVEGEVVTFVSLVGVRAPMVFRPGIWRLKSPAPSITQKCSHMGCGERGFIAYQRPSAKLPEVVCPLHIPRGVQSVIITERCEAQYFEGKICSCNEDGIEVIGEIPVDQQGTLWNCQVCGRWWVCIDLDDDEVRDKISLLENFALSGYDVLHLTNYRDQLRCKNCWIFDVKPLTGTQLKGVKTSPPESPSTLNLFDHLRRGDDDDI